MTAEAVRPPPIKASKPTPEDRAAGAASVAAWREHSMTREVEGPKDLTAAARKIDELHRARVRKEYAVAGLPMPDDVPGKMLVSLPLLKAMGYTIQHTRDGNVLVAPVGLPPLHRSLGQG